MGEPQNIDIGDPQQDQPYLRWGLYGPEASGENTYRWTTGNAVLAIPPVSRLRIAVSGGQPTTHLEIKLNGNSVKSLDILSTDMVLIDVEVPESLRGGKELLLTLLSGTFTPEGPDNRTLGVSLHEIIFLDE